MLLSVTFLHPTQPVDIFNNLLRHFVPWASPGHREKFYGGRPREAPPSGVKRKRGSQYSYTLDVKGYISETVQDTASDVIND